MSILIRNLYKKYGPNIILSFINFEFKNENKYILYGENGSGKTTLLKCILKQVEYYGLIKVDGIISYCPDSIVFPSYITLYSFIKCFSQLSKRNKSFEKELDNLLDIFKMKKYKYSFLGGLSKGQKEKVNIINTLITKSDILIMDEPYSGLDSESKEELTKLLLKDKRLIIIISHEDINYNNEFIKLRISKDEIIKIS